MVSPDKYRNLKEQIIGRAGKAGLEPSSVKCTQSICGQVSGRVPKLKEFCQSHDLVLFVSYVQSSNGKLLFAQCKLVNPNSWFVSRTDEVKPEWFRNVSRVGITGATSTPRWLLEEFEAYIKTL
jgi:4-hydroxy-3-methylbut-2-en-1-yl diphosphate reductase